MEAVSVEKSLGFTFTDKGLLERALLRKAYALECRQRNQECEDQEVFRTLGDAVLKAVLVELLMKAGCKTRDEITVKKKKLEREEALAKLARSLGIGPFIQTGIGERKQGAHEEPKVLAETLEALFGAVYLDGGFDALKKVVGELFKSSIDTIK